MLVVNRASMSDWARLYAWRNHPTSRAMFLQTKPVTLRTHLAWLLGILGDDDVFLAIVRDTARATYVGTFRLDRVRKGNDGWLECTVTVDPGQRGRGYGTDLVRLITASVPGNWPMWPLRARVKAHNYASLRAFADAGFEYLSQSRNIVVLEAARKRSTPIGRRSAKRPSPHGDALQSKKTSKRRQ